MSEAGTLSENEPHPAAEIARRYVMESGADLLMIQESLASCAIEGNRMAEICSETLRRLINKEPVSDRYFMGLAWMIWSMETLQSEGGKLTIDREALMRVRYNVLLAARWFSILRVSDDKTPPTTEDLQSMGDAMTASLTELNKMLGV